MRLPFFYGIPKPGFRMAGFPPKREALHEVRYPLWLGSTLLRF